MAKKTNKTKTAKPGLISIEDNKKLFKELVEKQDFPVLVKTFKLDEKFIEDNIAFIDINSAVLYQKFSEKFIFAHFNAFDPVKLAQYQELTEDFMNENMHRLNHDSIARYQELSKDFIMANARTATWNWNLLIIRGLVTEELINNLSGTINFDFRQFSKNTVLSESFIDKYADKLDMNQVSMHQKMSEGFIAGHLDKLNKNALLINKNITLSDAFKKRYLI